MSLRRARHPVSKEKIKIFIHYGRESSLGAFGMSMRTRVQIPKAHVNRSSVISAQKAEPRIPQSKQDSKTSLIDKLWV